MTGTEVEHQIQRIHRMRELSEQVDGELRIAVALAHRHGASHERLAAEAGTDAAAIRHIVTALGRENLDELAESELDWALYKGGAIYH